MGADDDGLDVSAKVVEDNGLADDPDGTTIPVGEGTCSGDGADPSNGLMKSGRGFG